MILGWQGFAFEHPDDWALSRVTGNRSRGFLALASSGSITCQVRWEPKGKPHMAAERYLDSLQTRKSKSDYEISGDAAVEWKRTGSTHGRGFATELEDGRLFLLEVSGKSGSQLLPAMRGTQASLACSEVWSVFGLFARIPSALALQKAEFLSARTRLTFQGKTSRLTVERLGLAEQLLAGRQFEEWIRTELSSPEMDFKAGSCGWMASQAGNLVRPSIRILAALESDLNQILVLTGHSRRLELLPDWDWIERTRS